LLGNGSVKNFRIFARQRLIKNFIAVTNTNATVEELLGASFSMQSVSYQGKQANSSSQNFLFIFLFVLSPIFILALVFHYLRFLLFFLLSMRSFLSLFLPSSVIPPFLVSRSVKITGASLAGGDLASSR
jgi:hypothetical protein